MFKITHIMYSLTGSNTSSSNIFSFLFLTQQLLLPGYITQLQDPVKTPGNKNWQKTATKFYRKFSLFAGRARCVNVMLENNVTKMAEFGEFES